MATGELTQDGRARFLADGGTMPLLGLGVWQVPDGPECVNAVRWALDAGYRHLDTAQAYGNEASVGKALKESGLDRDQVFITTSGIGLVPEGRELSIRSARPGDCILVSGTIGDHGVAIMSVREGIAFDTDLVSDCATLIGLTRTMLEACPAIRAMRDPTRGGVASVLNELAAASRVGVRIDEASIPVRPEVRAACAQRGIGKDVLNGLCKKAGVVAARHGSLAYVYELPNAAHALAFVGRDLQDRRIRAAYFGDDHIAKKMHELAGKVGGVLPFHHELVQLLHRILAGVAGNGAHQFFQNFRAHRSDQLKHDFGGKLVATAGDGLIHDGERVTHGTVAGLGENGKGKITVEQLLLHTSGLIADNAEADYRDGPEKAFQRIDALKPVAEPGSKFIYSDVNYITLGRLVEHLAGMPQEEH